MTTSVGSVPLDGAGLVARNIRKEYVRRGTDARVLAIDDFSISVAPGEFVTIVGPSGCGKSTFLSIVDGQLAPIILLWLGITPLSVIVIIFLGGFFTILVNTVRGVRLVDPRLVGVATSFGARQRKIFVTIVLPSTVPLILIGLRLGVSRSLIGVLVGELFAGINGLGTMIFQATESLQIAKMLFGVIVLIVIAVLIVEAVGRFERRFSSWRDDLSSGA